MRGVLIVAVSLAAGAAGTWLARRVAWWLGLLDHPNPLIVQHTQSVPYLGGVGIALGVALSAAVLAAFGLQPRATLPIGLALPALLFLGVGFVDDVLRLRPGTKFLLQAGVTITGVALGNRYPFTGIAPVDTVLSALWILTLVNAFNLTDVCDGLVGGLAVVALCVLAYLTPHIHGPLLVAGSTLGFLLFNKPPATIFLGDAGSHLLGWMVAGLTLDPGAQRQSWPWHAQMLLISAVPCFELLSLIGVRVRRRLPWWRGSQDHVALRLQRAGLTRLQTDLVLWSLAAVGGAVAITIDRLSPVPAMLVGLAMLGGAVRIGGARLA